ncbi:hypothetical protein Tco_0331762, partial [Tanacetum coccineum]
KNKAEAEAALLKAQPSFPNMEQLNELLHLAKCHTSILLNVTQAKCQKLEIKVFLQQAKLALCSSQPEREHIKKDKGKKAISLKDAKECTKENRGRGKAEAAKHESEIRKEELTNLLGSEVVNKKGPITLKVYREDDSSEIVPEFKANDLHLYTTKAELGIDLDRPLSEQDPLDRLNDLTNKKRNHANDIHDFFRANNRLKSSVQYKGHPAGTVLNEHVLASLASALQVLRRSRSIFTSVYVVVQTLKKDSWKELQFSLFKFEGDNTLIVIQPPCYSASKALSSPEFWARLDVVVLQWIYNTISSDLLHTILQPNATAKNNCYDGVIVILQQSDTLPPFYEACSRLIIKETHKTKQVVNAATNAGTAILSTTYQAKAQSGGSTNLKSPSSPGFSSNNHGGRGGGRNNRGERGGRGRGNGNYNHNY